MSSLTAPFLEYVSIKLLCMSIGTIGNNEVMTSLLAVHNGLLRQTWSLPKQENALNLTLGRRWSPPLLQS